MRKLHGSVIAGLAFIALAACGSENYNNNNGNNFALTLSAGTHGTLAASPAGVTQVAGTVVTVTATPDTGYKVQAWTGTDDDASISPVNHVTMTADKTVSVAFEVVSSQTFTLALSAGANGTITASPAGPTYTDGTLVDLTAHPDVGFVVGTWTGTDNNLLTTATNTVTMTANKTVGATFVTAPPAQKVLTLNIAEDNTQGAWGVTAAPPGTTYHASTQQVSYDPGTSVTLTGVSAPSWPFRGWSGDIDSNSPTSCSITVIMDVDRTITASIPLSAASSYCP